MFPQKTADEATFTEEILNRKLHFLCSVFDTLYYMGQSIQEWTK